MTFSPEIGKGRRPSIETYRGTSTKRTADEVGLPEREDRPGDPNRPGSSAEPPQPVAADAQLSELPPVPDSDMDVADSLTTYCINCGSHNSEIVDNRQQCVRCLALDFVEDPKYVQNWFDEAAEQHALQQAGEVYDKRYKQWASPTMQSDHGVHDAAGQQRLGRPSRPRGLCP